MKKLISVLAALCLLCASCAALADTEEAPTLESMPAIFLPDGIEGEEAIEESAFEGEWILKAAFAGTSYIDDSMLSEVFSYNFMPWSIIDGKLCQDEEDENGEFHTKELPYVFENGQLSSLEDAEFNFCVDLLVDGNIVLTFFVPDENGETINLALYLEKNQAE